MGSVRSGWITSGAVAQKTVWQTAQLAPGVTTTASTVKMPVLRVQVYAYIYNNYVLVLLSTF